jgi:hypothetical protein
MGGFHYKEEFIQILMPIPLVTLKNINPSLMHKRAGNQSEQHTTADVPPIHLFPRASLDSFCSTPQIGTGTD